MERIKEQKIVVSAAIIHKKKFLLLKRSSSENIFPKKWELPSGKVKFGENIGDALKREVEEETGLSIKHSKFISSRSYTFDYIDEQGSKTRHNVELIFLVRVNEGKIRLSSAHEDASWVTPEESKSYDTFKDIPKILKQADEAFL
jgi:8-oxo-dGTP diphosphatase